MFKPYALLLYLLSIIIFFVLGAWITKLSGAADGQGLAGGAIVFFYALVGSFVGLVGSIIAAKKLNKKAIVTTNKIFLIIVVALGAWLAYRVQSNKTQQNPEPKKPTKVVEGSIGMSTQIDGKSNDESETFGNAQKGIGLGFFKPLFHEADHLYFVNPSDDPIKDHMRITDSLVLVTSQYGDRQVQSAPPWFLPKHMKMDYGILLLPVTSLGRNAVEVVTNKVTGRTSWMMRDQGEFIDWESFLLDVFSIELEEGSQRAIHLKPFEASSVINKPYELLEPILIKSEWLKVNLLSNEDEVVGSGWLRWRKDNQLLITYSLLS